MDKLILVEREALMNQEKELYRSENVSDHADRICGREPDLRAFFIRSGDRAFGGGFNCADFDRHCF